MAANGGMIPRHNAPLGEIDVVDIAAVSPAVVQPVAQALRDKAGNKSSAAPRALHGDDGAKPREKEDVNPRDLERVWSRTLSALQSVFALAGVALLAQLLSRLASAGVEVSDDGELASAVILAGRALRPGQREGVLLLKAREALDAIRSGRIVVGRAPPGSPA